jgi:WD40 repeat protein
MTKTSSLNMKKYFTVFLGILLKSLVLTAQEIAPKLIVDDGTYQESTWSKQISVTSDAKYVLVSDFSSGVKIYETQTGRLINSFVGHAQEGDSYYDKKNNIWITAGDRNIKIWDITKQTLVKQVYQPFHSQFMNAVYVDSKKKFFFCRIC